MTHTPGPWSVHDVCIVGPTNAMHVTTNDDGTVTEHPSELIALVYSCRPKGSEDRYDVGTLGANARLIAAAPDLLNFVRAVYAATRIAAILGPLDTAHLAKEASALLTRIEQ